MDRPHPGGGAGGLLSLITIILVVATLYFARAVLIPLTLAVLLAFILTPLADWLERRHLRRVPSVVIVALVLICAVGGLGYVVARQMLSVAGKLPSYTQNIEHKIEAVRSLNRGPLGGAVGAVRQMAHDLSSGGSPETQSPQSQTASRQPPPAPTSSRSASRGGERRRGAPPAATPQTQPRPFFVLQSKSSSFSLLTSILGPILGPISTVGLVLVFSVFILLNRENLRNRVVRLAGLERLSRTTIAVDEAARGVSRYLFFLFVVNSIYACLVGLGLGIIGIPNPLLWGVLSGLLRFAPYIGPLIAAALPTLLSLGAFPGWTQPLLVIALYVIIEIATAYFVEPCLYGSKTGITAFAILIAAAFWTILWGPVGLLLSTPVTVSLVAFGKHIPRLGFFTILFGEDRALSPEATLYQRLLADDPEEAHEIAEAHIRRRSLEEFYDAVLIPVLLLAEQDRREGTLSEAREALLLQNARDLAEDLGPQFAPGVPIAARNALGRYAPIRGEPRPLAIAVPACGEADQLVAIMLAQLAARDGQNVKVLAPASRDDLLHQTAASSAVVCISALPMSLVHARRLYHALRERRTRSGEAEPRVVLGLWHFPRDVARVKERMNLAPGDQIFTSLGRAAQRLDVLSREAA